MSKQAMNFNVIQTHNNFDCEPIQVDDRNGMKRRVDLRIGYIMTVFGHVPTGFSSASSIVERLNDLHPGANYKYGDILPTLKRMETLGLVSREGGVWNLTASVQKVRAKYSKVEKNLRGL